jgi:hypothetical protein
MRAYCMMALAFALSACQPRSDGQVQQIDGRTHTTFTHGDLTLIHVELDSSTAVVFRSVGGIADIDTKCLSCEISEISACGSAGNSDAIRACAKKKCQDAGQCPVVTKFYFGLLRQ